MSKNVSASLLVNELLGYDSESEDSYDNDDSDDAGDQIDDEARGANSIVVPLTDLIKSPQKPSVTSSSSSSSSSSKQKKKQQRTPAASPATTPGGRDWKALLSTTTGRMYIERLVGSIVRRLSVSSPGREARVFLLQSRHDSIEEIVADLMHIFPPPPGSLGSKPTLRSEDRRVLTHVRQLYHDMPVVLEYDSLLPAAASGTGATPSVVVNDYAVDDDGNALTADDVDPDADVDDKLAMRRVLNQPNSAKTEAQLDAELDALLGADDAKRKAKSAERAASRSVGKSREWAAKSRERLQRSFHELAERLAPQAAPVANLNTVIVNAQLDELRALCEAYAPPLLIVSDAAPLRLAFRIDGGQACELAERATPDALLPCQLSVVVQLPIAYPKEAAVVKTFWTLAPAHVDEAVAARVDAIAGALSAKCAAQVGQPLLHALMTDASDWLAAFVHDAAVVAAAAAHPTVDEITEEHRVAWIHQLKWAFDWNFEQWPSPDIDALFYERARYAALEQFAAELEAHVRAREPVLDGEAAQQPLLGWVGSALLDDAALGALSTPQRLLASGRSVLARVLEAYEWAVPAALAFAVKPKQPWLAVERLLGVDEASSSGDGGDGDLSASVVAAIAVGPIKTPAHAAQLLLAAIDAKSGAEAEIECEICLCEYAASECTALACGHDQLTRTDLNDTIFLRETRSLDVKANNTPTERQGNNGGRVHTVGRRLRDCSEPSQCNGGFESSVNIRVVKIETLTKRHDKSATAARKRAKNTRTNSCVADARKLCRSSLISAK